MSKYYLTQAEALLKYRTALTNAKSEPTLATILGEFGYDADKIKQGEALLAATEKAFEFTAQENKEKQEAYTKYRNQYTTALDTYALDRKKAHVVFRRQPEIRKSLGLHNKTNTSLAEHIKMMKAFYTLLSTNSELATPLETLKITSAHLTKQLEEITALEKSIADYHREKGESEEATKKKEAALKELADWMGEFFTVAKIALADDKQLLEALNKKA